MDLYRINQGLSPVPDGDPITRHRTGTVSAVNADGTVNLDLGGIVVSSVSVLAGASVAVGSVVQVLAWAGDLLVLGRANGGGAGVASGILNTTPLTFTNTGFLDLDAVTGGTPGTAVIVTLEMPYTGLAQVVLSARLQNSAVGGITVLGYKVTGATTINSTDNDCLSFNAHAANVGVLRSWVAFPTLNAGTNVIEMQARVSGNTGNIQRTQLGARPW